MPTPEETKAAQEAEAAAQAAAAAAKAEEEAKKKVATSDDPVVLRAELERARKEAAANRVKVRELSEAKRKAEEAALAEQGKHKELAEARGKELDATKAELEQHRKDKEAREAAETAARAQREAQVAAEFAQLPDVVRAALPADASVEQKQVALSTYRVAAGAKAPLTAPVAPRPAGGGSVEEPTSDDFVRAYHPSTPQADRDRLRKKIADWKAQ
jgi:hypothetical protein